MIRPFDAPLWGLAHALSWIIWRTEEAVNLIPEDDDEGLTFGAMAIRSMHLDTPRPTEPFLRGEDFVTEIRSGEHFENAKALLLAELSKGSIASTGDFARSKIPQDIPASVWSVSKIEVSEIVRLVHKDIIFDCSIADNQRYNDWCNIRLRREDILRIWKSGAGQEAENLDAYVQANYQDAASDKSDNAYAKNRSPTTDELRAIIQGCFPNNKMPGIVPAEKIIRAAIKENGYLPTTKDGLRDALSLPEFVKMRDVPGRKLKLC